MNIFTRITVFFLFLFLTFSAIAADTTATWLQWKKDWVKKELKLNHVKLATKKQLIGNIEVIDIRPDTERVGVHKRNTRAGRAGAG